MKKKGGGEHSKSIFFRSYPHNCMPASILFFLCVTFFCWHRIWVQKRPPCYQKEEALRPICGLSVFKRDVYRMKRGLLSRGVTRIDLCNMSLENHVCCSVLQCVAVLCSVLQCVLQWVLQYVAVCCSECWFMWGVSFVSRALQHVAACGSLLQRPFPLRQHTHARRTRHIRPVFVCVCVCVCAR